MRLLAIDPGARGCGAAFFNDGVLDRATYVKNPVTEGDDLPAILALGAAVAEWAGQVHHLVVEWPQVYTQGLLKGDPNDLLVLAGVDLAVASKINAERVSQFRPAGWKGQLEKGAAFNSRVSQRLAPAELAALESGLAKTPSKRQHDVWDAVGIGLKALGRFERRRVYPR